MNALRKLQRLQKKQKAAAADALLQKLPKPPKENGVCACGCSHRGLNDHGPCPAFIGAVSDRCAICDHGITCHRRKGEPMPEDWNVPVKLDERFRSRYPRRINQMIATDVICPECGKPLNVLDTLKARRPSGEIVSGICPQCFERIEGVIDEVADVTKEQFEHMRDRANIPTRLASNADPGDNQTKP